MRLFDGGGVGGRSTDSLGPFSVRSRRTRVETRTRPTVGTETETETTSADVRPFRTLSRPEEVSVAAPTPSDPPVRRSGPHPPRPSYPHLNPQVLRGPTRVRRGIYVPSRDPGTDDKEDLRTTHHEGGRGRERGSVLWVFSCPRRTRWRTIHRLTLPAGPSGTPGPPCRTSTDRIEGPPGLP